MQLIFISIIRTAFYSFKDHPASLFDGWEDKARAKPNAIPQFHPQTETLKAKLESKHHSELRSQRAFKHLLQNGLKSPFLAAIDETEENTQEVISEMEEIAEEVVALLYELQAKAVEEREDEKAVSRFKDLVTSELPVLFEDLEKDLL